MTNSVTHFEIYGEEPAKLADFYRNVFGWQIGSASNFSRMRFTVEFD